MSNLLSNAFGLAITFFVSAAVWILLVAGLYQLVRDRIRQVRVILRWPRRVVHKGYGQRAG